MTDDEPEDHDNRPITVLARLVQAGLSEERARTWITNGGARVDGEPVTDPDAPAAPPSRVVLYPS
ncbi:hypothetical protein [Actinomycetospora flava]|uniref:RNA-binding S4 domain-containing protein n=1 Tax=Actinomycetospora flava TaxID=3129232 RepID=A0ABU8M5M0_9PSEU